LFSAVKLEARPLLVSFAMNGRCLLARTSRRHPFATAGEMFRLGTDADLQLTP